ncbi:hypothetical protein LP415_02240 [Polaromonas sp. P1(28)-8]|nr:hypothetical protein LP415_02240 [Polaromonas sp. P1(28)-8]
MKRPSLTETQFLSALDAVCSHDFVVAAVAGSCCRPHECMRRGAGHPSA